VASGEDIFAIDFQGSMSQDVTIRHVRQTDGESLVETWNDARSYYASLDPGYFQGPEPEYLIDADAFATSLRRADDDPYRFTRVAEVEGRVVGFITVHLDEPTANAKEQMMRDLGTLRAYVDVLVVHRSCWRQRVGRSLMQAAEGWARGEGAAVIKTDTNLQSPVSVPFYESLGYDPQSVIFRKALP
jgi:GNAT superfamily N-acetyltransferase